MEQFTKVINLIERKNYKNLIIILGNPKIEIDIRGNLIIHQQEQAFKLGLELMRFCSRENISYTSSIVVDHKVSPSFFLKKGISPNRKVYNLSDLKIGISECLYANVLTSETVRLIETTNLFWEKKIKHIMRGVSEKLDNSKHNFLKKTIITCEEACVSDNSEVSFIEKVTCKAVAAGLYHVNIQQFKKTFNSEPELIVALWDNDKIRCNKNVIKIGKSIFHQIWGTTTLIYNHFNESSSEVHVLQKDILI